MDKFFPDTLIEKQKRSEKIREYINRTNFNAQQLIDLLSPCMETHFQGKTRNYIWKIKSVVAQFRLGSREAPENTTSLYSWFVCTISGSFSHHLKFYSSMFRQKISSRVVCVNGKQPRLR